MGSAGGGVADDDDVDAHGFDVAGGVDEGFAFAGAAGFFGEVDDVGGEALGGEGEGDAGAGGIFGEESDHDLAAKGGDFFDGAGGGFFEGIRGVEGGTE